jgi:uncharacterized protein (DUF2267 family)
MTTIRFYRKVLSETGLADRELAKRGVTAVLHALRDRLTPDEARQLAAQLPRELRDTWEAGDRPGRSPQKLHRSEFYERVRREARLRSAREARAMTLAVFAALKGQISPGEADDVLAQLPRDLKDLWEDA